MQFGQDYLDPGNALLRMDIHRHPPTVVYNLDRTVFEKPHVDACGKTGDGLVDTVVDDLLGKMIGATGIGIHTGAFTHRLQSAKNLYRRGIVCTHLFATDP